MNRVEEIVDLLEKGLHDKAKKKIDFIREQGLDEEKWFLGEELVRLGFLQEAYTLFDTLLKKYPDDGEIIVRLAEVCFELDEEEKAIELVNTLSEDDPNFPKALLLLADIYLMEGLYEVSEQKLLHAKEILPDEVVIDFALGELYLEQGRFREAIRSYEKVLEKEEEIGGVNIHQRIGDALSGGGAFEEALPHYEKALESHLEINTLFNYGLTAYQAGLYKTAIQKLNELKELDPDFHPLYLYLAKAYEKEKELEKCYFTIIDGIRYDEFNKELYFYGGKIALKLGKEDDGERLLKRALTLDPEYIESGLALNKLYLHQEKYNEVLSVIQSFKENAIEEPEFLWDEAVALNHLEKYSEALDKYKIAYDFFKNEPDFLLDYGYFLVEEGKNQEAIEIFRQLLKMDPTNNEYEEMLQRLSDAAGY